VSIVGGTVRMKSNNEYRKDLLVDMLQTSANLVSLPDVEFLINMWDHPKVPQQNIEPVFAMYADDVHNDVAVTAAHAWDDKRHAYPQPHTEFGTSQCPQFRARKPKVFFRGGSCTGPTEAYRAWGWRFYNRKRVAVLSKQYPDLIDGGLVDFCGSRKVSKLEWPWDKQMVSEMRVEAPLKPRVPWHATCHYRYLLNLDGNAAASRLASLFHTGSAVFLANSPFYEWWYPLLKPWVHYVPVGRTLDDLVDRVLWANAHPNEVAAIGAAGAAFARQHLHTHGVACYWWQLLTEFAALQSFKPRTKGFPVARWTGKSPR
jgi:protein glucosyltransferase